MNVMVYKIKPTAKFLINSISILVIILGSIMVLFLKNDTTAQPIHWISAILMIFFGILAIQSFNKLEIIVDDEKIEVRIPLRKYNSLSWNEIKELTSFYLLFPEAGGITLISRIQTGKKNVHISIWGMPIQLMLDILSHLPPDAGVYLYPYLKRKVERKQTWFYKS